MSTPEQSISLTDLPNPILKVFISHLLDEVDLATTLREVLREKNIAGYIAVRKKKYEIGFDEKIKRAIIDSDYLVPILTNNGFRSPSVNQEIGFAIGKDVDVISMIEEESEKKLLGVLTHSREPEYFTRETFPQKCKIITDYLVTDGKKKARVKTPIGQTTLEFLKKRNLTNPDREEFTINPTSDKLYDGTQEKPNFPNTYKRLVQFSACPVNLPDEDVEISYDETRDWINKNSIVTLGKFNYNILPSIGNEKIGIKSLIFRWFNRGEDLRRYLEFQNNGYLEQGEIDPLIRKIHFRDDNNYPVNGLHLNWVIGAYWGFLMFARNYNLWRQVKDDVKVSLNIHNTDDLMLFGIGAKVGTNEWTDPTRPYYDGGKPVTEELNVQVANTINANSSDDEISKIAYKASVRLCNAYGLPQSRCYDDDGTFNTGLFSYYARIG